RRLQHLRRLRNRGRRVPCCPAERAARPDRPDRGRAQAAIRRSAGTPRVNSSRVHLDAFARRAGASVSAGSPVLAAGAGHGPYRQHFAHTEYEAADFEQVPGKDYAANNHYVCDLASIPVESDRYDLVLLSQVLEHLPDPEAVLRELRRVLKPSGRL